MSNSKAISIKKWALAGAGILALAHGAALAEEKIEFDIDPKPLGDALNDFGMQSDEEILFVETDTRGKETKGVEGFYEADDALDILLNGSGIDYRVNELGTFLVGTVAMRRASFGDGSTEIRPFRVAQVDQENIQPVESISRNDEDELKRDTIVVTGTSIRGIAPDSSPTRTFSREEVQVTGAATIEDFVETLTANFGGGSNADLGFGAPNDPDSAFNSGGLGSFGSSINLRGLGSGSTLVLMNGRRLAPSSGVGNFTDISLIPASAIERVEILTDGASAIYGSDAIAGVANFILRDEFEGIETFLRYGLGTEESSAQEVQAAATIGLPWESGHALATYEYYKQDALSGGDRSFLGDVQLPNDIIPRQERHSALISLSQNVTEDFELFAEASYARRDARRDFIAFNFLFEEDPSTESLNFAFGGDWDLGDSWVVDFSTNFSELETFGQQSIPAFEAVESRQIRSRLWVGDLSASGAVATLPGGDIRLAVGGQIRDEAFLNTRVQSGSVLFDSDRRVYAGFGELFIPLIGNTNELIFAKRLEVSVAGRYDDYTAFGGTFNPKVGLLWSPIVGLNLRGTYSTAFLPPPLGRVGGPGPGVSARNSARDFELFGLMAADPSLADTVVLTVSGTPLDLKPETSRSFTFGSDLVVEKEKHRVNASITWFDVKFDDRLGSTPVPGTNLSADAPNVAFRDPSLLPPGTVIFNPTLEQINSVLETAGMIRANDPPTFGDPFDATVINFAPLIRNLATTRVSGLDADIEYQYDGDIGQFLAGISVSYLDEFSRQATIASPVVSDLNTFLNPVDLRLRGRVGYSTNAVSLNAFVNYVDSYRTDQTEDSIAIESWTTVDLNVAFAPSQIIQNQLLSDLDLRLSVINLFDKEPPFAPGLPTGGVLNYDPSNASALGRFVAIELTKRF